MGDQRGNPDSNAIPIHMVTLPSFEIMRTEVTVSMYRACVNAGACTEPNCVGDSTVGNNYCNYGANASDYPVNYISWYQINDFAAWVGARLPTEVEWEYTARGQGQNIIYPWGNTSPTCTLVDYNGSTCGVGTSPGCAHPTGNIAQGVCDMAGNVWEWTQDEWHTNYNDAPSDGRGWCTGECPVNASDANYDANNNTNRVMRGGRWSGGGRLHTTNRDNGNPSSRNNAYGGRLIKSLPLTP